MCFIVIAPQRPSATGGDQVGPPGQMSCERAGDREPYVEGQVQLGLVLPFSSLSGPRAWPLGEATQCSPRPEEEPQLKGVGAGRWL